MTRTTIICGNAISWLTCNNDAADVVTIHDYVAGALGEFGGGYDVDGIEDDFRAEIDMILPDGYCIAGQEVIADVDAPEVDREELAQRFEGIGFWAIVQRHEVLGG